MNGENTYTTAEALNRIEELTGRRLSRFSFSYYKNQYGLGVKRGGIMWWSESDVAEIIRRMAKR